MKRWAIERRWRLRSSTDTPERIPTRSLAEHAVCCLLGAAGSGKTVELKQLEEFEEGSGFEVQRLRLATVASSPDGMARVLTRLASAATERTAIYIDAVDEAMIPMVTTGQVLAQWIDEQLRSSRPRLRITCRSAVWPGVLMSALEAAYGAEDVTLAFLDPLDDDEVRRIADGEGVDGGAFVESVIRSNAVALSRHPLTLQMLLNVYRGNERIPTTRRDLFARAIDLLVHEREERRELGTVPEILPGDLVEVAERLACFLLLSGSEVVDLADSPGPSSLGFRGLCALPGGGRSLDDRTLRALGRSGLCEGAGPNRFRFVHRQVAEYLAGRRIARLLPHQAKALLCSGLGWRAGVAGPLRETAAFAAAESPNVARWVAETDPEVVGLSEVADDDLRRLATLGLLERFRSRKLTDWILDRGEMPLDGLRYPGAELDLRPVLGEREEGREDVLDLSIRLVKEWELDSLHADLADLVLDAGAPLHARVSAGYVLSRRGDREVRGRLRPLVSGCPGDPDDELKGIALRCCWPEHLSTTELLGVLEPWGRRRLHGAYFGFLIRLDGEAFDAAEDRLDGLRWGRAVLRAHPDSEPDFRIAQRISHGALGEVDDPAIAGALVDLLVRAAEVHSTSPLDVIRREWPQDREIPRAAAPLFEAGRERRVLLERLISGPTETRSLCQVTFANPGLLVLDDFPWLLERACDSSRPSRERERFAELAGWLPVQESQESLECWLRLRDRLPPESRLARPTFTELDSDGARRAREEHAQVERLRERGQERRVGPLPEERVRRMLELAETKDWRYFAGLCRELTLGAESTHYDFQRFVTRTPGWKAADPKTCGRIVEAARRVLTSPTDAPEAYRDAPANSILTGDGYMEAAWLLLEQDADWLATRPSEWWGRWTWYFLREIHPLLSGEPEAEKGSFFRLLHSRAAESVRDEIASLVLAEGEGVEMLMTGLLGLCEPVRDPALDARLAPILEGGAIPLDRLRHLGHFLLGRDRERAIASCRARLDAARREGPRDEVVDGRAVAIAWVLLHDQASDAWEVVLSFLGDRPDLARRVLAGFAHGDPPHGAHSQESRAAVTDAQRVGLLELLLEHFPPESDVQHIGVHWVSEEDSAVQLRDQLLRWLCEQKSFEALEAARRLEMRFGARYPWLRRPRSMVERAYRQWFWSPIPTQAVAALLADAARRLIRSESDAVEGVIEAILQYEHDLRHAYPSPLEDLWNTPGDAASSPKSEERVSDKLCEAIRRYFREHAVVADREVQVFRRNVPRGLGGAPGSEVDVLVSIPGPGSTGGDPIAIPVEVKRSCNREARIGMREQLVDRYMSELGTGRGVFVVAWLDAPGLSAAHRPVWSTIDQARAAFAEQAEALLTESGGSVHASWIVVDASLR